MGWAGFNCSLPHKVAVIEHLDAIGASASIIGAVNCVVFRENRAIGENTDGQGFLHALRSATDPAGKNIVVFGAGGAARAIAVEVALAGAACVTIVNRSPGRGEELVELVNTRTQARSELVVWDHTFGIPNTAEIVVNATSIGLFPDMDAGLNLHLDTLRPGLIIADVIPNPPRTRLIRDAEARGCVVLDGLGMLVNQGVISIKHWTGIDADPAVMRQKLESLFREE